VDVFAGVGGVAVAVEEGGGRGGAEVGVMGSG